MKFIHCADLHLDSKIESNLPSKKSSERRKEILRSFSKMVDYAKNNEVTAIIIAGDLFDVTKIKKKTCDFVLDTIKNTPEIDFLYLRGNHDNNINDFDNEQVENLKRFENSWTYFNYDNVTIGGIEMTDINCSTFYDQVNFDENKFNIAVLHGQVSASEGIDCIKLSSLKNKNIDYLALGHIHLYKSEKLDNRGIYTYCGCLEGRGFDECGDKGFVVVNIENNNISTEFISNSIRTLYEVNVDISGKEKMLDLSSAIKNTLKENDKNSMVKINLVGKKSPNTQIDIDYFTNELDDFFFVKIKDKSHIEIDIDSLSADVSLKGEFIRKALEIEDENLRESVISYGIKALAGEDIE